MHLTHVGHFDCQCPQCHQPLGQIASTHDGEGPEKESMTFCSRCGTILVFTEDLQLERASPELLAQIEREDPEDYQGLIAAAQWHLTLLGRDGEPPHPPDPAYPHGIDIEIQPRIAPRCTFYLPSPAPGMGTWMAQCRRCGAIAAVTCAKQPDDPRSVSLPCAEKGAAH
jgi:hypothetical protein